MLKNHSELEHKSAMLPTDQCVFKISYDPKYGRHLIANQDIQPGTVIINEPCIVEGPSIDSTEIYPSQSYYNVCPVCYKNLIVEYNPDNIEAFSAAKSSIVQQCQKCNLSLCSMKCCESLLHSNNECKIFAKLPQLESIFKNKKPTICCQFITTVRMLFFKYTSTLKWRQLMELQSNVEEYTSLHVFDDIDESFNLLTWDMFNSESNNTTEISNEGEEENTTILHLARRCLGVLRTNAFSQFTKQLGVERLFFFSSFMSHSCLMNTDRYFITNDNNTHETDDFVVGGGRMKTVSAKKINKGEQITTIYISYLASTNERQNDMERIWDFNCTCQRCIDPEECGSELSTVKCPTCNFISLNPFYSEIDGKLKWLCKTTTCKYSTTDPTEIQIILENSIMPVELAKPNSLLKDLDKIQLWLDEFDNGKFVSTNHSIFIQTKFILATFYGHETILDGIDSFIDLLDEQIIRKALYAKETLNVLDKFYQGVYLFKGILMFHLWSALQAIIRRQLNVNPNSTKLMYNKISDLVTEDYIGKLRFETYEILKYSEAGSLEEFMASLLEVENFIKS